MLENKKRDQHYVFQAYLKNWVNTNGKLWCMREGKVFYVKTSNIAFEKDFYRVNSLSNNDIEFIKLFFYKSSDAFKKEMDYFLKLYTTIDKDEKIFELIFKLCTKDIPEISETIDDINKMIDIARNNIMEEVYCDFEGEACDWLKNLCKEDIDFLYTSSKEEKEKFFVNKEFPQGSIKAENGNTSFIGYTFWKSKKQNETEEMFVKKGGILQGLLGSIKKFKFILII